MMASENYIWVFEHPVNGVSLSILSPFAEEVHGVGPDLTRGKVLFPCSVLFSGIVFIMNDLRFNVLSHIYKLRLIVLNILITKPS
jgi:hypothetical protein